MRASIRSAACRFTTATALSLHAAACAAAGRSAVPRDGCAPDGASVAPPVWTRSADSARGLSFVVLTPAGTPPGCPLPTLVALHFMGERPEVVAALYELPVVARVLVPGGPLAFADGFARWPVERYREPVEAQARGVAAVGVLWWSGQGRGA